MGGVPRRITSDGESNERPRWSPDSKSHRLHLRSRRLVADLAHESRWLRREAGHQSLHRSRRRALFARRQEPGVHQRRLSRLRRRRLQQAEARRREDKQGESPHLHGAALPPLDPVADEAPQPSDGGPGGAAARPRISRPARRTTCRRFPSAARTITTFRPTARKSATR